MYERYGAYYGQNDNLYFDGGLKVSNYDGDFKSTTLLNLISEDTQEKLFVARSIDLGGGSVKIENPDSNTIKITSTALDDNYDIELNYVTANGVDRFLAYDVYIPANASQTFVPEWTDLPGYDLKVLYDYDNDGTVDDSLELQNQASPNSTKIKIFLEGPYSSGSMSTELNTAGYIPLSQPYNTAPWNYNGFETVQSIPTGVDWVLVELRTNTTIPILRRAAFLLSNGSLVDLDGTSNVSFPGLPAGNYYLVVYHRNHIPIMTANPVQVSETPTLFDISAGSGQAYGINAMKDLGGGVYGLYTADTDGSGTVNAADRSNIWNDRNLSGYYGTDVDLSGTVNAADRSSVWNNRNLTTQVPTPVDDPEIEILNKL